MGPEEKGVVRQAISERLVTNRQKIGKELGVLAEHLHQEWEINNYAAREYIRSVERGSLFGRLKNSLRYEEHEQRVSDYFSLLGLSEEEREDLLQKIKQLSPGFEYRVSKVSSYK